MCSKRSWLNSGITRVPTQLHYPVLRHYEPPYLFLHIVVFLLTTNAFSIVFTVHVYFVCYRLRPIFIVLHICACFTNTLGSHSLMARGSGTRRRAKAVSSQTSSAASPGRRSRSTVDVEITNSSSSKIQHEPVSALGTIPRFVGPSTGLFVRFPLFLSVHVSYHVLLPTFFLDLPSPYITTRSLILLS
jgi:hypothetical protein